MVTCVRVCSHNRLILLIMFLQFIFMIESYIPFVYLFTSVCFDLITLSMVYNKVIRQIERKREKPKGEGRIRWLSFIFLWMNCIFIDGVLARRLNFWSIARSNAKRKPVLCIIISNEIIKMYNLFFNTSTVGWTLLNKWQR